MLYNLETAMSVKPGIFGISTIVPKRLSYRNKDMINTDTKWGEEEVRLKY